MAEPKRRRVDYSRDRNRAYSGYEDGNAVRVMQEPEEERHEEIRRRRTHKQNRKNDQHKKQAQVFSRAYVVFLTCICVAALGVCVNYLRLKSTLTTQYEKIAVMESQYNRLKDDNDARYNEVINSVKIEDVKESAQTRLDMHYADADQIQYYTLPDEGYIRQYAEVPSES